jgi:hypothetical protein
MSKQFFGGSWTCRNENVLLRAHLMTAWRICLAQALGDESKLVAYDARHVRFDKVQNDLWLLLQC